MYSFYISYRCATFDIHYYRCEAIQLLVFFFFSTLACICIAFSHVNFAFLSTLIYLSDDTHIHYTHTTHALDVWHTVEEYSAKEMLRESCILFSFSSTPLSHHRCMSQLFFNEVIITATYYHYYHYHYYFLIFIIKVSILQLYLYYFFLSLFVINSYCTHRVSV